MIFGEPQHSYGAELIDVVQDGGESAKTQNRALSAC